MVGTAKIIEKGQRIKWKCQNANVQGFTWYKGNKPAEGNKRYCKHFSKVSTKRLKEMA